MATPVNYRKFGDAPTTRQLIFDNVFQAAQNMEPITNERHSLHLSDVKWSGPDSFSKADVKHAVLTGGTLARRLVGKWQLHDNQGNVLDEKRSTLAHVPYLTDDGMFVQRGNQYSMAHQMRLDAGIYTRQKHNGELEAHVNVLPGQGRSHRLQLDPETGIFKLNIGQASMPLFPLLHAMGASEQQMRDAWGDELLAGNRMKNDPQVIGKLFQRVVRRPDALRPQGEQVAEAFRNMKLDPEVTQRTLGSGYDHVGHEAILAATKKLLAINRGEAKPDDRDHLAYQRLLGPEDLLAERIAKDRGTMRQLLWKSSARGNLGHVQPGVFNKALTAAMMSSGLASPIEAINPAEVFDQQTRVTRMGEGGIPSLDSVPDESRAVQSSHFGFIDPLRTPESAKIGVDLRLSRGAQKGSDGRLYMPVRDRKTGQLGLRSPQDLADATAMFPGEANNGLPMVSALRGGTMDYVHPHQVNYDVPEMEDTFSPIANMVPLKSALKGQRAVMASRMLTQALPLTDAEAPLVQSGMPGQPGRSFEEEYGQHMGAMHATQAGQVTEVTPDRITLKHRDGTTTSLDLHNNTPSNRKTFLHQRPVVQVGQTVQPKQLLARSNYTDQHGTTALGKNFRVAYMPFRGKNYEDAFVVSQSAARRLTSEHAYQHKLEYDDHHQRGKNAFISLFPAAYDQAMLANFDADGHVKPGTQVQYGQPLVLAARERERAYGQVHRGRAPSFADETIKWQHHSPGTVTDVVKTDKGVNVVVQSRHAMQDGDKLSGRHGNKGVVLVIPDDQMPTDREGRAFEVLANPLGLPSRVNPSQIVEAGLGKIAARTGKPYKVEDWKQPDLRQYAEDELRKHGLRQEEDVIDAETGRKIPDIATGNAFFMKLHHESESKAQGRGLGSYTADETPAKGGDEGAKRIGMLELSALLAHGATHVIRDAKLVRGQANPEHWSQFMSGFKPGLPKVPHVYEKFLHQLQAAGINPVREGTKTHLMAMTDADVAHHAGGRELQNTETVDWKGGLKPKPGGLFDESLTGGHGGKRWSQISLHEPMPNPVMEDPIRRVLGLTEKKFRDVLAGHEKLNDDTGPLAIQRALSGLNVTGEIARARQEIQSTKKTARDAAIRRLKFLTSTQRLGIHPRDWMLSKVPVLPPAFRPVTTMGHSKLPLVADANYLYKEVFDANQNLKAMSSQVDDVGDERLALYDAFKGVTGLGDPIHPKNVERNVKGVLQQIFSSSPKMGTMQRRLLGVPTDLVGRSVITPNPDLDMDQVGLPEGKAWEVYKPFVVRDLVRRGMPRLRAAQVVKDRKPEAREALLREMDRRPVLVNRAPVLHRYGMMAAYPRLTQGHTLQISPIVVGGFGADFDGDAEQYHVPSTDEAAQEAVEKMLPSRNLLSAATFRSHYLPTHEYLGGLHTASARINLQNRPRVYPTTADAIRAYRRGDISVDQQVEILHS